jgi:hypothetical protein
MAGQDAWLRKINADFGQAPHVLASLHEGQILIIMQSQLGRRS